MRLFTSNKLRFLITTLTAFVCVCVCMLSGRSSWAADPSLEVDAHLSNQALMVGDVFTLEISIVARADGAIEVEIPEVEGLSEQSRSQSESTSIAWTSSGQSITREQRLTIEFSADKAGTFKVGPIQARAGGVRAQSKGLVLRVLEGSEAPTEEPVSSGEVPPPSEEEQHLFVRYRVDRVEAYLGEQILLDFEIYANPRVNFGVESLPPPPTVDGFWREILDQPQRLERRPVHIAGRRYDVYRAWRVALFPLEAGDRLIPATQGVFSQNRSIFQPGTRLRRKAPPLKLKIKPLPSEKRPQSFEASNVGEYQLKAEVDATVVPAGKAVLLRLSVTGNGNIKNARLPEVPSIEGFRAFPPTITDDVSISPSGVAGEKRAEILLMPLRGGRLEIPSFKMPIFDPADAAYVQLATTPIAITVEGNPAATGAGAVFNAPETPQAAEKSASMKQNEPALRPLRYRSRLALKPKPAHRSQAMFALFFAPPMLFLFLLIGERVMARVRHETPTVKLREALRQSRAQLKEARAAVESGQLSDGYAKAETALLDYASVKTGITLRGLTTEAIGELLSARGALPALVQAFVRELEAASYARFAPTLLNRADGLEAAERWDKLLSALEGWSLKEGAR